MELPLWRFPSSRIRERIPLYVVDPARYYRGRSNSKVVAHRIEPIPTVLRIITARGPASSRDNAFRVVSDPGICNFAPIDP